MSRSDPTDETASPSSKNVGRDDATSDDVGRDDVTGDDAGRTDASSDDAGRTDASSDDAGRIDVTGDDAGRAQSSVRATDDSMWRPTLHDERAIRVTTTVVLGGLGVLAVLFLLSLLPGLDAAGRAFAALGSGVLGTALAATVGYLALVLPRYVRTAFDVPRDLRAPAASALTWTLVLAAILAFHRGFAPLYGLLDGPAPLYDGLFFVFAIGPVVLVARALWRLVDPAATLLSRELAGSQ